MLTAPNQALEVHGFLRDRLALLAKLGPGAPRARPLRVRPVPPGTAHRLRRLRLVGLGRRGGLPVAARAGQPAPGFAELGYLQGRGDRAGFFAFLQPGALHAPGMKRLLATFLVESVACLRDFKPSYSVVMLHAAAPGARMAVLARLLDDFHAAMLSGDALAHWRFAAASSACSCNACWRWAAARTCC
ncbi:hypothetical protein HK414_14835 [Ramlibacter terrae]|uniref:Uncharacterized protein n=1 Tax=Ramlibacter terrae TaxID=2732511 RepID=A0ABX6P397_9BURK|nr:hypothetical protein HK414_14835 [Ramlibacter terrae]